jgi:oligogalacturonide lyase
MVAHAPRAGALTRRALILLSPAALAAQSTPARPGESLGADWRKFPDEATEFEVLNLTHPTYDSRLPAYPARALDRRGGSILVASNRTGSMQALRLDLRSGRSRVLTAAADLDPGSLTFASGDRAALYFDGPRLVSLSLRTLLETDLYRIAGTITRGSVLAPSEDGLAVFFVEKASGAWLLRLLHMPRAAAATVAESPSEILEPAPNPRRATVAWRNAAGEMWAAAFDGTLKRRLHTPPGRVQQILWNPDGRTVLYLLEPDAANALPEIREQEIDAGADRLVARTSRFARFARNSNASVFAGASRSKASPYVLLLLRLTRRELTLCEHRAADAGQSAVCFSPDSQRVFFQGDRDGRPAVYSIDVERLVEKTGS